MADMKDTTRATATGTMLIDRLAMKYSCGNETDTQISSDRAFFT